MSIKTPFHPGELQVQERLGVRERVGAWARNVVRPFLLDQHREFYEHLPFIVAAARDQTGDSWVTLLSGAPGFISAPNDQQLHIDAKPVAGDPLEHSLSEGTDVGFLGLEFASRRRNRVNGRIGADGASLLVDVEQSFGNCPQYIHPRDWETVPETRLDNPVVTRSTLLTQKQIDWIQSADTFFIASGHRGDGDAEYFGMDASHRGGAPGFVQVSDGKTLSWPDYAGNNHYNTIGNLVENPSAGLLFVDFEHGHTLQLTGHATVEWGGAGVEKIPGAQRLLHLEVTGVVECRNALPMRWSAEKKDPLSLCVEERRVESEDTLSFVLRSADSAALPKFTAGQHLPVVLEAAGSNAPIERTYSLSSSPADTFYRLTVKRHALGAGSTLLHDTANVGSLLRATSPTGSFVLHAGSRPVVLLSAGVGVTPMLSMLGALELESIEREVQFIHVARNSGAQVLAREVRDRKSRNRRLSTHIFFSQPLPSDVRCESGHADYNYGGRIDAAALDAVVADWAADFYLCGPAGFLTSMEEIILRRGVASERIFVESFGG